MQRVLDPAQIEAFAQRAIPRVRLPSPATVFSVRAARLRKLSEGHAVGDYLRLMAALSDAQQSRLDAQTREPGVSGARIEERLRLAHEHGLPPFQATLWPRDPMWHTVLHGLCDAIAATSGFPAAVTRVCRDIQASAPAELETQARLLLHQAAAPGDSTDARARIDAAAAPFIMAALQVSWAAMLASLSHDQVKAYLGHLDVPGVCPVCGTLPVASRVSAEKAYQGYRYLHCALCATEWHLVRIKCTQCNSTEGIHYHSIQGSSGAVRAEACDRCRTYRKICYQEQDPEVEPLADDLASLGLDLLMSEQGFQRASGNPLLWQ